MEVKLKDHVLTVKALLSPGVLMHFKIARGGTEERGEAY